MPAKVWKGYLATRPLREYTKSAFFHPCSGPRFPDTFCRRSPAGYGSAALPAADCRAIGIMTTITSWLACEGTGMKHTFAVSIGGAAGQGVATPGNIFARIFARRGLHLNAYNAYQSIIRGGHTFLTIRTGPERVTSFGDKIDLLIPLNQDTMDRHLALLGRGAA